LTPQAFAAYPRRIVMRAAAEPMFFIVVCARPA
jgi:hypothetical protein